MSQKHNQKRKCIDICALFRHQVHSELCCCQVNRMRSPLLQYPRLHRVLATTAPDRGGLSLRGIALDFSSGLTLFWPSLETWGSDIFSARDKCNVMELSWKHARRAHRLCIRCRRPYRQHATASIGHVVDGRCETLRSPYSKPGVL